MCFGGNFRCPHVVLFTVYYIHMNRSQEIDILCWYLLYLMFMGELWWSLSYLYICRSNVGLILRKIYPTCISMRVGDLSWGGGVYPHYSPITQITFFNSPFTNNLEAFLSPITKNYHRSPITMK